jgi:hypothetical protein
MEALLEKMQLSESADSWVGGWLTEGDVNSYKKSSIHN